MMSKSVFEMSDIFGSLHEQCQRAVSRWKPNPSLQAKRPSALHRCLDEGGYPLRLTRPLRFYCDELRASAKRFRLKARCHRGSLVLQNNEVLAAGHGGGGRVDRK